MIDNIQSNSFCEFSITVMSDCPHLAKVRVTRPNPVDPKEFPKHFCYSHLSAFIKRNKGQFLVEGEI